MVEELETFTILYLKVVIEIVIDLRLPRMSIAKKASLLIT